MPPIRAGDAALDARLPPRAAQPQGRKSHGVRMWLSTHRRAGPCNAAAASLGGALFLAAPQVTPINESEYPAAPAPDSDAAGVVDGGHPLAVGNRAITGRSFCRTGALPAPDRLVAMPRQWLLVPAGQGRPTRP